MNTYMIIKFAAAFGVGLLTYFFGKIDAIFVALVCVVIIDYISGVVSAVVKGTLNSKVGFIGLIKKVAIFLLVALAGIVDKVIPATNEAVQSAICMFYIANEALSIIENAGEIGLPIPNVLKKAVERLNSDNEK